MLRIDYVLGVLPSHTPHGICCLEVDDALAWWFRSHDSSEDVLMFLRLLELVLKGETSGE
jgi:hypothetical protein